MDKDALIQIKEKNVGIVCSFVVVVITMKNKDRKATKASERTPMFLEKKHEKGREGNRQKKEKK